MDVRGVGDTWTQSWKHMDMGLEIHVDQRNRHRLQILIQKQVEKETYGVGNEGWNND